MDRKKKKRSNRKKQRKLYGTPLHRFSKRDPVEEMAKTVQKSLKEEATTLETPFGDILTNDDMFVDTIRNKHLLFELLSSIEENEKNIEDPLANLVHFEKLSDKYPNESFLKHHIALCYKDLKYKDKYRTAVKENFELFNGEDPNVDAAYIKLLLDLRKMEAASKLVGESLNIHQLYPKITAFDEDLVHKYYQYLFNIYRHRGDEETARNCLKVIENIDPRNARSLGRILDLDKKPVKKWLNLALFIGLILSVVVGFIWLIIKFFQWIF